jgi:uncharacterized protein YqgC (DUF456 family)
MTDTNTVVTIVAAIGIVVGIFGTIIPFVPGLALSWAGVLVWAIFSDGAPAGRWLVFSIATILAVLGTVLKYLLPGRNLKREGVTWPTLLTGGVLGIIGFFVIPVVGLFFGFVLGIFVAEMIRLHEARLAWPATWKAVKAVGVSMIVEIFFGLAILVTFLVGLLLS